MKKILAALLAAATVCSCGDVVDIHKTAVTVAEKGLSEIDLGHYYACALYNGMANLACATGDPADLERVGEILDKFATGEMKATFHNFMDYEIGGQASAILACKFGRENLVPVVKEWAAKMWAEQPRTSFGVFTGINSPRLAEVDCYWIDIAATVTPFYLYAGLLEGNQEYIDYAAWIALRMAEDLYDEATGLYHQGYNHPNMEPVGFGISQDCWSRGNGWIAMAYDALIRDYPRDGKYWEHIEKEAARFYGSVVKFQDPDGVWHQEMTDFDSYVEVSGSCLILAGLGTAIEYGLLGKEYLPVFEKGLKGVLKYVDPDGCVGHTCMGCCVPLLGTKADFAEKHFYFNENHSFAGVEILLSQALKLGYKKVRLDAPMGSANDADRPRAYARIVKERKDDVAWENDRVAFRVYSQIVANKAASGVDFWPKTVDRSIIDEWYGKEASGGSYHVDDGTGCDFYNMGTARGIGGTGLWQDGKLVCSEVYDEAEIVNPGPGKAVFTLRSKGLDAAGKAFSETKTVEIVCGTSFYKVTDVVTTEDGGDIVLAAGVSTFSEDAAIDARPGEGKLFVGEKYSHKKPVGIGYTANSGAYFKSYVGSAVVGDPAIVCGVEKTGADNLLLMRARSGEPVVFYVGACFSKQYQSGHKPGDASFWSRTADSVSWNSLEELYN